MEKYYRFAGVEVAVSTRDAWMYEDDRTLASFRVREAVNPYRFRFAVVDELTPPAGTMVAYVDDLLVYEDGENRIRYKGASARDWSKAYIRTSRRGAVHEVQVKASAIPNGITAKTVLNSIEAEHLIATKQGFVFHSSYIDIGGRAILFTAPSGTGKSTQADLWHDLRGARILNGDRSAICCSEDGIIVCGVPFKGSSQYCENVTLPLAGIVYLAQAPRTSIRLLRPAEAFRRVWEGVSVNVWDKNDVSMVMDTVSRVVQSVPVWHLACTPDESAVIALEQQLGR